MNGTGFDHGQEAAKLGSKYTMGNRVFAIIASSLGVLYREVGYTKNENTVASRFYVSLIVHYPVFYIIICCFLFWSWFYLILIMWNYPKFYIISYLENPAQYFIKKQIEIIFLLHGSKNIFFFLPFIRNLVLSCFRLFLHSTFRFFLYKYCLKPKKEASLKKQLLV